MASCWGYTRIRFAAMVVASFLSILFLSFAVAAETVKQAESLSKLFLTKRVSAIRNIVNLDRLRVNNIMGYEVFNVISSSAEIVNATAYLATIGVGCPPTNCKWLQPLVVD